MNHLEGTLERDGDTLVAVHVGGARFGIGRVVREAEPGERVRIGLRPEEVHANTRGEGAPATCQTAMVLGHHLQIVAVLETGEEIVARQRRAGDEGLTASRPATSCGSAGARPRPAARSGDGDGRRAVDRPSPSKCRPDPRKERTRMPDRPDELNILVPSTGVADVQRMVTRRQALIAGGGAAMAAYLAGCGGSTGGGEAVAAAAVAAARSPPRRSRPTPADGQVETAICCWPTGSTTPTRRTTRATRRSTARRSTSPASAPTTRSWPSCAPAARSTTSSRRPATR